MKQQRRAGKTPIELRTTCALSLSGRTALLSDWINPKSRQHSKHPIRTRYFSPVPRKMCSPHASYDCDL